MKYLKFPVKNVYDFTEVVESNLMLEVRCPGQGQSMRLDVFANTCLEHDWISTGVSNRFKEFTGDGQSSMQ